MDAISTRFTWASSFVFDVSEVASCSSAYTDTVHMLIVLDDFQNFLYNSI